MTRQKIRFIQNTSQKYVPVRVLDKALPKQGMPAIGLLSIFLSIDRCDAITY